MKKFSTYSIFFFLQIGSYCFHLIFLPLYCKHLGFSSSEIAIFSAAGTLGTVIGPILFSFLADKYISVKKISLYAWIFGFLFFLPMFIFKTSILFTSFFLIFFTCFVGITVLLEAQLVKEERSGGVAFEKIRLFGSVGFVLISQLIAAYVDAWGKDSILYFALLVNALIVSAGLNISPYLPRAPERALNSDSFVSAKTLLQKNYILVVLMTLLTTASHGTFFVYFSIYLKALQFSTSEISLYWNLCVVFEILMFIYFSKISERFSLVNILKFSSLLTICRWLILMNVQDKTIIYLTSFLHAFSFAALFLGARKYIAQSLPPTLNAKAQGLHSGLGTGLGALIGRLQCFYAVSKVTDDQSLNYLFSYSIYLAFAGLMLTFFMPNKAKYINKLEPEITIEPEI